MQKFIVTLIIFMIGCIPVGATTFNASVSKNYDIEFEKIIIQKFSELNDFSQLTQGNDDLFYQRRFLPTYILSSKEIFSVEKRLTSNMSKRKIPNIYNLSFSEKPKNTNPIGFLTKPELAKAIRNIQRAEHTESLARVKRMYESAIAKYPNRIELLYKYSLYLYSKRDFRTAIAYLNSVKIKDRNFLLASYTLGNIYFDMKDYKNSIRHNLDVISKNPYCADAYYNIASALEQMREFDLAIDYYQKCLGINSSDTQAKNAVKRLQTIKNASI